MQVGLFDLPFDFLFSRLTAMRPNVSKHGVMLVATSDWRSQLWSLGFGGRKVLVDPQQRVVRLRIRRFWGFIATRRLEFDWVEQVIYGYHDVSLGIGAYREQDLFRVALKLKNGEEVLLFRFYGEGDFVNNSFFPDWMFWEDNVITPYVRGNQESESLLYADLVSRMIGVPLNA